MPYREKTAWLTLIAIALTFGPYFGAVAARGRAVGAVPDLHQLGLFAIAVAAQVIIMAAGFAYFAITSPHDARTPPDERDRAITSRSITFAYYVLIAGMVLVGGIMPFNSSGWAIINAALFMIVAAEVVHYGIIVISYRRQA
ncbi:MAG TPA: hypothetical protein VFH72_13870 [Candidatus Baltobacteraceae bacterium]|nr:hypothetical protein [Candidatus Baltobacteraceae bacterium]